MTDNTFEQIRLKALEKVKAKVLKDVEDETILKLQESIFIAASFVCSEMLKEYHNALKQSSLTDRDD